jgi:hypothetical protein
VKAARTADGFISGVLNKYNDLKPALNQRMVSTLRKPIQNSYEE